MSMRLNEVPGGLISLDHKANIIDANDTFLSWMHLTYEQVAGMHIERLLTMASKMMFHAYFYPAINLDGQVDELFIHFRTATGESSAYLMNAKKYMRDDETVIVCLLIPMAKRLGYEVELRTAKRQLEQAYHEKEEALLKLQDLHDAIKLKQQELMHINNGLVVLSNTDKLTGIANRRLFHEYLNELEQQFQQEQIGFSLLLIDIDFFKQVNDTFGHAVGDIILQRVATVLTNFARPEDRVARYGGEEFIMLLPNTDVHTSLHLAQQLNQAVVHSDWSGLDKYLTISIGIATYEQGYTTESVIDYADQALYYSKQHGRNCATHYQNI